MVSNIIILARETLLWHYNWILLIMTHKKDPPKKNTLVINTISLLSQIIPSTMASPASSPELRCWPLYMCLSSDQLASHVTQWHTHVPRVSQLSIIIILYVIIILIIHVRIVSWYCIIILPSTLGLTVSASMNVRKEQASCIISSKGDFIHTIYS